MVALSLANLCFLAPWLVLLNPKHYTYYNWAANPGFVEIKALLTCVVVLGVLFWIVATLIAKIRSPKVDKIARWALLLILLLPLNSFVADYLGISIFERLLTRRWLAVVVFALAIGALVLVSKHNQQLARVAITLVIILSPLLLVNAVSAVWFRNQYSPAQAFEESRPAKLVTTVANTPQIIWILFDELDQHTAFIKRPAGIKLPEFDRFKNESVTSTNAHPPNMFTMLAVPALTTGRLVAESMPLAANEIELTLKTGEKIHWGTHSNVFSQARSEGFSTGVSGWYHPYCRVIGGSLDSCSWVPVVDHVNPALDQLSLSRAMWISLRTAVFRIPFVFRLFESRYDKQRKLEHREEFDRVAKAATALVTQDLNLKLLHFPIPHHPWIYDANRQAFTAEAGNSYGDNLVLADRTLGELRRALEEASKWDSSIVVVSSDHWWRQAEMVNGKRDERVPFMIKLAGQKTGMEYQKPFNTILTRQLLIEVLRGNLTSPADVAAWMDRTSASHLTE